MEILTSENTILIIGSITILLFIINFILLVKLNFRFKKLFRGQKITNFEDLILSVDKDLKELKNFKRELELYLQTVEKRLSKSIQGVENINFNAFKGSETGGKSFATAFLNEKGDGVIISSLYARERISIFSKQVKGFKPEVDLSEEEKTALTKAKESCSL
jgi:hypothetical protein